MSTADAVLLGLLGLFALWGALRGGLRQSLGVLVLAAAFPLAARLGPRIEPTVVKAVSIEGADLHLVAWATVFAGTLVLGGVLIAAVGPLFGSLVKRARGLGALLGLAKGAVVLTVLLYATLLVYRGDLRPAWVRQVEASQGARVAHHVAEALGRIMPVPDALAHELEVVDQRITGAERRPSHVRGSDGS